MHRYQLWLHRRGLHILDRIPSTGMVAVNRSMPSAHVLHRSCTRASCGAVTESHSSQGELAATGDVARLRQAVTDLGRNGHRVFLVPFLFYQSHREDRVDGPADQLASRIQQPCPALLALQGVFIPLPLGGGTGYERGTLRVRGDVLLWVALQASLMAECFADGAGDADGGIGVSELVGASDVSEHAADGDFGLCRPGRSSCRRWPEGHRAHLISSCCYSQSIIA